MKAQQMTEKQRIFNRKADIARVAKELNVCAVLLFGSCARGEEKEESDIDLAIMTTTVGREDEVCREFGSRLQGIFGRVVHVTHRRGLGIDQSFWDNAMKDCIRII